jgi:hypothetical protein
MLINFFVVVVVVVVVGCCVVCVVDGDRSMDRDRDRLVLVFALFNVSCCLAFSY